MAIDTAKTIKPKPAAAEIPAAWVVAGSLAVLAAAHAPLLYWHLCSVLAKPHYQFIVLLPVAVGFLLWRGRKEISERRPGSIYISYGLGIGALFVLGMATQLWSPWLGSVAATLSVLAAVYVYGGTRVTLQLMPAWLMLWFAVALPLDLDSLLIQALRGYATNWTSAVLDWIGIRHLVEGNVIHVPEKAFFVADACTGIHSLFVVAAMAMFLGFWNKRRPHQVFALILCAFVLVLIENVSRLVAVVAICDWGVDVSAGWRHKTLGGIVFVATLGLLLSADQLISFAVPQRLLFFWPWLFNRKKQSSSRRKQASGFSREHATRVQPTQLRLRPFLPLLVCFLVVGLWQVARAPANAPQIAETLTDPFEPLRDLPEDAMPPRIGDWIRKEHKFVERDVEDPQGQYSHIWTYESQSRTVDISVDFPFSGVHDACLCFENTGWTINKQQMLEDPQTGAGIVEAYMSKPLAGDGYLLSSFFNTRSEFGARVYPRDAKGADDRLMSRLNSFVDRQVDKQPAGTKLITGPVVQIRLAAVHHESFGDSDTSQFVDFYRIARVLLEAACREHLQVSP